MQKRNNEKIKQKGNVCRASGGIHRIRHKGVTHLQTEI